MNFIAWALIIGFGIGIVYQVYNLIVSVKARKKSAAPCDDKNKEKEVK